MYIFHCFPHKIKTHYHQVDQVTQTSENGHCESNDNTKKTVFKLDLHCFLVFSLLTKKVSYFMIFFLLSNSGSFRGFDDKIVYYITEKKKYKLVLSEIKTSLAVQSLSQSNQ